MTIVTTFGIDDNYDLYLGAGDNLAILNDLDAVLQACETATRAQLGEMVLATETGIPNFQTIWVGTPNYTIYTDYLRRTFLSIPGVLEVTQLTLKNTGDVLNYTATIKTAFGTGAINGV